MECSGTRRRVGSVTIVDLSGRITVEGKGVVRDTVKELVENGEKTILLNLAGVNYVDSAGLGELVGSFVTAVNQGGTLKLLNVQKRVGNVLHVTNLDTVFQSFTDETEALASFAKAGAAGR